MGFARALNDCCSQLDCSNRELSECSGLSASSISRYRSAGRTPEDERTVRAIARAIATIARTRGMARLSDEREVFEMLLSSLNEGSEERRSFCTRLDALMGALSISNADMARHANVDPSYISRIRGGQRIPSNMETYASALASFAARRVVELGLGAEVESLIGPGEGHGTRVVSQDGDAEKLSEALRAWLVSGQAPARGSGAERFLGYLDDFDLNEYISAVRFDRLKVPVSPIVVPRSRTYYGLGEMREAELEFLKATATARATGEVILYSNMPMAEMGSDEEFAKRYVTGLAALVRRGIHLSVIHDLNRPFDEMMMGLEGYIPLYMTGQISPYWLDGVPDTPFCQLINSSEVAMLEAECVRDHHDDGRYRFSTRREDVEYARLRARQVLAHAKPLMEIYRTDDPARLERFEAAERRRRSRCDGVRVGEGAFRNLLIWSYPDGVVVISKTNDPVMHFEIRHPALCNAIANFSPSVADGAPAALSNTDTFATGQTI